MNPARTQIRGTFLTAEESTAAATDPEAAFDHLARLALATAATIRNETKIEIDGGGVASRACPAIHSRALVEMVMVTAEVIKGRREWRRRAQDFLPPWPANTPVARLDVPVVDTPLPGANERQKHRDSATEAA